MNACKYCGRSPGLNLGLDPALDPNWDGDGDVCFDCFEERQVRHECTRCDGHGLIDADGNGAEDGVFTCDRCAGAGYDYNQGTAETGEPVAEEEDDPMHEPTCPLYGKNGTEGCTCGVYPADVPRFSFQGGGDQTLTITFEDEAHETFEGHLIDYAEKGYTVALNGVEVELVGCRDGILSYRLYNENALRTEEIVRTMPLRDEGGFLTVYSVKMF